MQMKKSYMLFGYNFLYQPARMAAPDLLTELGSFPSEQAAEAGITTEMLHEYEVILIVPAWGRP